MLRSKSRSGYFEFGRKSQKSAFSRTISASKFCRGDPLISQIDAEALKPVERNHSNHILSETMGQLMEELKMTKAQLEMAEEEKDRALDELRGTKMAALNFKKLEKENADLKIELDKAKAFEVSLAEKDVLIDSLEVELSISKASRAVAIESLSESKKRIQELEDEIENRRELSERKMCAAKVFLNKIEQENSKLDSASVRDKLEKFDSLSRSGYIDFGGAHNYENSDFPKEGERVAPSEPKSLLNEINSLQVELKSALEAEKKSKKAMDDLSLALQEVTADANNANDKLSLKEMELDKVKQEAEQYLKLLNDAKKENDRCKNTIERLRLEADESLLAWNEREIGFVNCVKEAEDERTRTQQENIRLLESLKSANAMTNTLREENLKLRDVLKEAINEGNIAKHAAGIAKIKNSLLNNSHSDKDEGLDFLTRENRRLSVKELNRPLIVASIKEPKTVGKKHGGKSKSIKSMFEESKKGKMQRKRLSFDLSELKKPNGHEDVGGKVGDEDPFKAELLKGSIFDTVDSPRSEPHKLLPRRVSFSFTNGETAANSEDFDHLEGKSRCDDSGSNWFSKRSAFLQTFEDLIKRRSVDKQQVTV